MGRDCFGEGGALEKVLSGSRENKLPLGFRKSLIVA